MPSTGDRNDPYAGFNFLVEIDGVTKAGFSEASGLDVENEIIEYRNGSEATTKRKLPGLRKYTNVALKRGFTADKELWDWRKKVLDGKTERQSDAIVLMNEAREPALRFVFRQGWPSKWQGPPLNAGNSEVAIETLEIACEEILLET
jgi:phage tail-like protein